MDKRTEILGQMFKSIDPQSPPYIEPPFTCDYVSKTSICPYLCLSSGIAYIPSYMDMMHISCFMSLAMTGLLGLTQGYNVILGSGVYMNFGCILLDCNTIEIGNDTMFGPNVQFYPPGACKAIKSYSQPCLVILQVTEIKNLHSAGHPLDAEVRDGLRGPEYAHPIKIGKNCWIGGSVIFLGTACLLPIQTVACLLLCTGCLQDAGCHYNTLQNYKDIL